MRSFGEVFSKHPYAKDFFTTRDLPLPTLDENLQEYQKRQDPSRWEELGVDLSLLGQELEDFLTAMESLGKGLAFRELTIISGHGKGGQKEAVGSLRVGPGDVISVVGPTGSGKSRLLEDIECLAQGDTPTGRTLLVNGKPPAIGNRFSMERKLVAQISQNMNFVMDCSVREFVILHAESRLLQNTDELAGEVIRLANELAGESFGADTPLTSLSGGQSRALMIADTACLSRSPIVLIDEIENAGVDRRRALSLLVKKEKLIFLATHDPLLALMAQRRIVIRGGSMDRLLETTEEEKMALKSLEEADEKILSSRQRLRAGERLVEE